MPAYTPVIYKLLSLLFKSTFTFITFACIALSMKTVINENVNGKTNLRQNNLGLVSSEVTNHKSALCIASCLQSFIYRQHLPIIRTWKTSVRCFCFTSKLNNCPFIFFPLLPRTRPNTSFITRHLILTAVKQISRLANRISIYLLDYD